MIVDKLPWCSHSGARRSYARIAPLPLGAPISCPPSAGSPIYTIHAQPAGTRFATGGGDVRLWNLLPALDAREEHCEETPKLLATLTEHNGTINVVRFSHRGNRLATGDRRRRRRRHHQRRGAAAKAPPDPARPPATPRASGSDDFTACVYELRGGKGAAVLGAASTSVEDWRLKCMLRGHALNVIDLAWSPDDAQVATASLDNRVIIWDAASGKQLHTISAHCGPVKGVAWDPVGTYLATQARPARWGWAGLGVFVWVGGDGCGGGGVVHRLCQGRLSAAGAARPPAVQLWPGI
jgi:protein HIRA/HIR1